MQLECSQAKEMINLLENGKFFVQCSMILAFSDNLSNVKLQIYFFVSLIMMLSDGDL